MSGATVGAREITIRGVVLGALITLVFTAANVYLGLRVGLTFATSIPAAVISMGVLRLFANHSVVENNIVQTIASAAGTLSSIIFVLPALLMIGWWSGFPYWTTAAVCALGGILGVMYSIPLRRALVTGSDLPYPEGVAGAEVLKIGDSAREMEHNRRGIGVIALGAAAAAGYALLASLRVINNSLSATFRVGSGATMIGASLSLALIGVGHLVGVTVGVAMIVGLAIAFGVMLPIRTAGQLPPDGDYAVAVARIFSTDVRFIGAGLLAVGGRYQSGAAIIAEHTHFADDLADAELIVTGEGRFDEQSLHGKVVGAIAAAARPLAIPVIVLAGQVSLDKSALRSAGIMAALSIAEYAGSVRLALADAANQLMGLASQVAARLGNSGPSGYR